MNLIELRVPDIGGAIDVNVSEILVKIGDKLNLDDPIISLETDKATMEVPAERAGIIREILVKVGDKLNEGDVFAKLEIESDVTTLLVKQTNEEAVTKVTEAKASESKSPEIAVVASSNSQNAKTDVAKAEVSNIESFDEDGFAKAFASPSIRKLARELGVDLSKLTGSGEAQRITEEDVKTFVKAVLTNRVNSTGNISGGINGLDLLPWPQVDFTKFGEIKREELSRIKKISGANLLRNWVMIPHVTIFEDADITEMEEFRQQLNLEYKKTEIKITPLAFLIKACTIALQKFPELNASLDGDSVVYKKYYNIGFAADTPNGLVVPVMKNADKKGLVEIAQESSALAKLAREGKLKPSDMQGGTFTVSSLGGIGSTGFTPIINAPEVAILGVSKAQIKPIYDGQDFKPRLIMPLSLSFDHRFIDGALGTRFVVFLAQILSDLRRMSL